MDVVSNGVCDGWAIQNSSFFINFSNLNVEEYFDGIIKTIPEKYSELGMDPNCVEAKVFVDAYTILKNTIINNLGQYDLTNLDLVLTSNDFYGAVNQAILSSKVACDYYELPFEYESSGLLLGGLLTGEDNQRNSYLDTITNQQIYGKPDVSYSADQTKGYGAYEKTLCVATYWIPGKIKEKVTEGAINLIEGEAGFWAKAAYMVYKWVDGAWEVISDKPSASDLAYNDCRQRFIDAEKKKDGTYIPHGDEHLVDPRDVPPIEKIPFRPPEWMNNIDHTREPAHYMDNTAPWDFSKPLLDNTPGKQSKEDATKKIGATTNSCRDDTQHCSPLALDLNRDGKIATLGIKDDVHFDLNGDGHAQGTGWIAPTDGLLVRDIKGDGSIVTGESLFGENTVMPDGSIGALGFEALAALDVDHLGVIDARNPYWKELKIWQDLNSDGKVEGGELKTLDEWGITSINLNYEKVFIVDENNNIIVQHGTFTWADGTTSIIQDILFIQDYMHTEMREDLKIEETIDISILPDLGGLGKMYDLHQAMLRDPELKNMVQSLTDKMSDLTSSYKITDLKNEFEDILYKWAGVSKTDLTRGYMNKGELEVIEAILGTNYLQRGNPDPMPVASGMLTDLFNYTVNTYFDSIYQQATFGSILSGVELTFDLGKLEFNFNFNPFLNYIREISDNQNDAVLFCMKLSKAFGGFNLSDSPEFISFIDSVNEINKAYGGIIKSTGSFITETNSGYMVGSLEPDFYFINSSVNTVSHLGGNDIYYIQSDVKNLTILTSANAIKDNLGGTVIFEGRNSADAVIGRYGNDIVIKFTDGSIVTIKGFTESGHVNPSSPMDEIIFADGKIIHKDDLIAYDVYIPQSGSTIYGINDSIETLHAGDFNGTLYGGKHGGYTLAGGKGDVSYYAGIDSETTFILGSGKNTVNCSNGVNKIIVGKDVGNTTISMQSVHISQFDTSTSIRFEDGITANDITYAISGKALIITIKETGHTIRFDNFINSNNTTNPHILDNIEFSDGIKWDTSKVLAADIYVTQGGYGYGIDGAHNQDIYIESKAGTASSYCGKDGSYVIHSIASSGTDSIYGGVHSDMTYYASTAKSSISLGTGNNTLVFGKDYGNSTITAASNAIYDPSLNTTIKFAEGITADDLIFKLSGTTLTIQVKGSNNLITINNYCNTKNTLNSNHVLDSIELADGTKLDAKDIFESDIYVTQGGYGYGIDGAHNQDIYIESKAGTASSYCGKDGSYVIHSIASSGTDSIYGGVHSDMTYYASTAKSSISLGTGNNTLVFGKDYGNSTITAASNAIYDPSLNTTIKFAEGITADDLIFKMSGTTLTIQIKGSNNLITINNYCNTKNTLNSNHVLDSIELADGTKLDAKDIFESDIYVTQGGYGYGIDGAHDQNIYVEAKSGNSYVNCGKDGSYIIKSIAGLGTDCITGGTHSDMTYYASTAKSTINLGTGNNTLVFGKDYGNSTITAASNAIYDPSLNTTIKFAEGITADDLIFKMSGTTLTIQIKGSNNIITISNYCNSSGKINSNHVLDNIELADGTKLDTKDIFESDIYVTQGGYGYGIDGAHNQDIYIESKAGNAYSYCGKEGSYVIHSIASSGTDYINGGVHSDMTYYASTAKSSISLGTGNNTLVFGKDYGNSTITAASNAIYDPSLNTTIKFAEGITADDLIFKLSGTTLTIQVKGSNNLITINNFSNYKTMQNNNFGDIELFNGEHISFDDIARANNITVSDLHLGHVDLLNSAGGIYFSEDDVFSEWKTATTSNKNIINSSKPNELYITLSDTYLNSYSINIESGFKNTTITSTTKNNLLLNEIKFSNNIKPADVHLSRVGDDLIIRVDGENNFITVKSYFSSATINQYHTIDTIKFADGSQLTVKDFINNPVYADNFTSTTFYVTDGFHGDLYGSSTKAMTFTQPDNTDIVFHMGKGDINYTLGKSHSAILVDKDFGNLKISSGLGSTFGYNNEIIFDSSISISDISYQRIDNDLILSVAGNSHKITLSSYFSSAKVNTYHTIDTIKFADGSQLTVKDFINNPVYADNFTSTTFYVTDGFHGDLYGSSTKAMTFTQPDNTDIVFHMGKGDINYTLGKSHSAILVDKDFGNLKILSGGGYGGGNTFGYTNEIIFDSSISLSDVSYQRIGNDLVLSVTGNSHTITLQSYFSNSAVSNYHTIDVIKFADGSYLTEKQLANAEVITSTSNYIYTSSEFHGDVFGADDHAVTVYIADDSIVNYYAGKSSATINLGNGESTIIVGKESGNLTIQSSSYDFSLVNKIVFGSDVSKNDVSYYRVGTDLVISILGSESKITVKGFYNSTFNTYGTYHTIESIEFMDGSKIGKSVLLTAKELMKGMYMPDEDLDGNILSDDDLIDTVILNDDSDDEDESNENEDSDLDEIIDVVITEEDFIALEENGFTFLMSNSHGNVDIENGDLIFNSEVTTSNLWMKNVDGDLIINVLGTDEEIVVQNWFNGEHGINNIVTADGVEISSEQIENFVNQMSQFGQPEDPSQVPPQINQMWESL